MIALRHVSKTFKLYRHPSDRLVEWMRLGRRHKEFHALRDINLVVPPGRTLGVVGQNGAGKSTLLKLITGTLLPSEGTIEIGGRVAALLELGTGFHGEFTGRQNIYINGQLLGLHYDELQRLEPEIIGFSELGPFIDQPIRTYSSGMVMRLGFAVASAIEPELLIVDEALSVGDARFSQKCIRRIREIRENGATILFVSHDPGAVTTLCDEAILLEAGELRSRGTPKDILEEYKALLAAKGTGNVAMKIVRTGAGDANAPKRHGTFQAVISRIDVCNARGVPADVFHPEDLLLLRVRVDFLAEVAAPTVGFLLKDRLGLDIYGTNTALQKISLGPRFRAGEYAELEIEMPLRLGYGDYSVTVAVHEDETHLENCYEWTDNAAIFRVRHGDKPLWTGLAQLDPKFKVTRGQTGTADLEEALRARFGELPDPMLASLTAPSPFLEGFGHPAEKPAGAERLMAPAARFLFQPRGRQLRLKIAVEGEGPVDLTAALSGNAELGMLRLAPGRHVAAFPLPDGLTGLHVFDLVAVGAEGGSAPQVGVYEVSSSEVPEESGQWPITTFRR